jgi:hypothetical protein
MMVNKQAEQTLPLNREGANAKVAFPLVSCLGDMTKGVLSVTSK